MDIYKMVENQETEKIIDILNIKKNAIYKTTYESCSLVIGLKNKMVIDVCCAPENISMWYEPENPLFD